MHGDEKRPMCRGVGFTMRKRSITRPAGGRRQFRSGTTAADALRGQPWNELRNLCALMANDLRQAILVQLTGGPLDVSTLAMKLGVSVTWVSHNLKRLLDEDVVHVEAEGQRRIYGLSPTVRADCHKGSIVLELTTSAGASLVIRLPKHWRPRASKRKRQRST